MAANGIEILIDVLAQEAISTTDEFVTVITDAADKAGTLAGSIGELDTALSGITKSGTSAEDMSVKLVTALEDFGIQAKDSEGLAAAFADTLKTLGISGEKAAGGLDLVTKANEEFIGPSNAATDAVYRQGVAFKEDAVSIEATAAAIKGFEARAVASSIAANAAVADLGTGFAKMTTLSEMATPALMKAASWAGIGLAGLAYEGIKQYTQFNKLITQTITQAGEAPSKFGFLSSLAESVAKSTGQHLTDVANTIYRAASGTASWNNGLGATKKQLTDIVTQVSKLNVVGGIATGAESEQASRVVTALINSDIRGVGKDPQRAAALVNAVVGSGDMRLADLVPGIGRGLLGSAVANNMTAQDALAWVATLTSQGTTASVAGNYVKTGINLLAHPSAQGVQALAMLGIKPGELENLMSGPGGLVSALSTLKAGMSHLNPGNAAQFFYHEAGIPRPGGAGLQGAVAKLQTWSAGELSQKFISDWERGQLTPQEQTQATDLILTKAFGGSKQFATIAAVLNNLNLVKGIEAHISSQNSVGYFNAQYARTAATPAQQFKRMQQSIIVDLVNIGKELTPVGLAFGHAVTGIIGGLSRFKGVLYGFVGIAASLLAFAGAAKVATLATHIAPFIGAAYNRLGLMAGKDSAFTKAMNERANGGAFKFLNIYGSQKHGILSKIGGDALNYTGPSTADIAGGATIKGLSQGENALNTTIARGVTFEEETAANTRIIAEEMAKSGMGNVSSGGGISNAGGRGGAIESAAQRDAAMATSTPRDAMYFGAEKSAAGMAEGTIYKDAKSGRYMKVLAGGRRTFVSNAEAYMSGAMNGPFALGAGTGERFTAAGSADTIALGERSALGGVDMGLGQFGPALEGGLTNAAAPVLSDVAGSGMMAGLGETLGGIMGGPIGMIGMMAAPALIGALSPSLMKLGSFIGNWLGGNTRNVFHPHIGGGPDSTQASAAVKAAAKALHQYQTLIKNKAGKPQWVNNEAAIEADMFGYHAALTKYQLATHTYAGSVKNANKIATGAIDALYGPESKTIANMAHMGDVLSGHKSYYGMGRWGMSGVGSASQMQQLINELPRGSHLRIAMNKMMHKNGANWQDFSELIGLERQKAHGVLTDTFGSSAQWQGAHTPLAAALVQGGYFSTAASLSKITTGLNTFLNNKHVTVADAAKWFPTYAHAYHVQMTADQKVLAEKNLSPEARAYFKAQYNSAKDSHDTVDKIINEMRRESRNTHIAGESVDKLAKENASALAANGITAPLLAAAIAKALSPYIRQSKVVGSSGPVTRTTAPTGGR